MPNAKNLKKKLIVILKRIKKELSEKKKTKKHKNCVANMSNTLKKGKIDE